MLELKHILYHRQMVNRTLLQLTGLLAVIPFFVSLLFLFSPCRQSFNYTTLWSHVSLSSSHHKDEPSIKSTTDHGLKITEAQLPDGTVRFTRSNPSHTPSTLILVLTRDADSWSHDYQSAPRTVYDFLDLLTSTKLSLPDIALGILTASQDEFKTIKKATDGVPFGRVTILHREDIGSGFEYGERHKPEVQDARRALLARLRNYLMNGAIQDEKHVFWIDADVAEFSPNIMQTMLNHAEERADVGILTARCERDTLYNYDMNAWKVAPGLLDIAIGAEKSQMQNKLEQSKTWVPDLIKDTKDKDLVALDSVGGTLLYIRAELVRQGLIFPWWNVVGAGWERDGYVGLETEGLCFLSSKMEGGGCFVLGGKHKTRHADQG